MAFNEYMKRERNKFIPDHTDWSNDMEDLKWKSPKEMDYNKYFWFSAYNYLLLFYGLWISNVLVFSAISYYAIQNVGFKLAWIPIIITLLFLRKLIQNIIKYKYIKGTTLYSLLLQDKEDYISLKPEPLDKCDCGMNIPKGFGYYKGEESVCFSCGKKNKQVKSSETFVVLPGDVDEGGDE